MGSKRALLRGEVGSQLERAVPGSRRFVDLFSGSAVVSHFAATRFAVPVLAVDLQCYSTVLSNAVLRRTRPARVDRLARLVTEGEAAARRSAYWNEAIELSGAGSKAKVLAARELCATTRQRTLVWRLHGGHYFSPVQALVLDCILQRLPDSEAQRSLVLAAVVAAASRCAASPGHTAQPLQPTRTGLESIRQAWSRDAAAETRRELRRLSGMYSKVKGRSITGDALHVAARLRPDDFVFIDPPYSAAQYSRFYHVLETIARGRASGAEGRGRYPPFSERPQSAYSTRSGSKAAIDALLTALERAGCHGVLTFPRYPSSNGLDGEEVVASLRRRFRTDVRLVRMPFSSMGGNGNGRAARFRSSELVVRFRP